MSLETLSYRPLKTGRLSLQPLTPALRSTYDMVASKREKVIVSKPEAPTVSEWLVPHKSTPQPKLGSSPPPSSRLNKLKSFFESKSQGNRDGSELGPPREVRDGDVGQKQHPESQTRKKVIPYETVAYNSKEPDRRAYIIHLHHGDKPTTAGIVTLTGRLVPIGLMRDDDIGPRQFRWDVDVFVVEEFRRQGIATEAGNTAMKALVDSDLDTLIGHRARLATPGSEEGSNPHYSSGRQVSFEAVIDEENVAGVKLATKLGMREIGWTMSATSRGVIRSRHILDWVKEAEPDAEYRVTRTDWKTTEATVHGATTATLTHAGSVQSGVVSLDDPGVSGSKRSQYWEPKLVSTDRLFLLPLTTRFEMAWKAIQSYCQAPKVGILTRLEDVLYDSEHRDRRAYAVFRPEDLVGIPSDMVPLDHQQEKCIGILKMAGKLCEVSKEAAKRRFEWHVSVFVISSHEGNGYASESLVAALEGLKGEDDDPRGWEGLGEDVVVYAEIVGAANGIFVEEKALRDMGVKVESEIGGDGCQKTRLVVDMLDGKTF